MSTTGLDAHSGGSPSSPTSFRNAWNNLILRTGSNSSRTTGYRIYLASGTYDDGDIPNYFENSHGTYQFPVVIQAQTPGTVTFTRDFNVFNCRFLYLIDLSFSTNGDSLHFEACHYVLLRRVKADGRGAAQETLKVNQCSMFFVESSEFSGAYENNLDYVAVQSGHILSSKFHGAGDWCAYVKGGSAYIRVHGNQFYNCGTGGFTAGQGSGYEFMTSPWLFYEAVDVKFSNNLIHDTGLLAVGLMDGNRS